MTTAFQILSTQKPRFGEPCNGCGFCCQAVACDLSRDYLHSTAAPCIALEWDGVSAYRCGLVTRPAHYLGMPEWGNGILAGPISKILAIGRGCDSGDSTWRSA